MFTLWWVSFAWSIFVFTHAQEGVSITKFKVLPSGSAILLAYPFLLEGWSFKCMTLMAIIHVGQFNFSTPKKEKKTCTLKWHTEIEINGVTPPLFYCLCVKLACIWNKYFFKSYNSHVLANTVRLHHNKETLYIKKSVSSSLQKSTKHISRYTHTQVSNAYLAFRNSMRLSLETFSLFFLC